MAEFNPRVGDVQPPNYQSRMPEIQPNRAFETLFSGLGEALGAAVQSVDTNIQQKIETDARGGFDSLNSEMGLTPDAVSKQNTGMPDELTQSQEGLSKLAMAHQQGKITPEYYYQRLASQAKALRAKYPGYEKEVDGIIQNVTGTRPANAFRDALLSNLASQQAAMADTEKQWSGWLMKDQNLSRAVILFPDIQMNPEKYADPKKRAEVQTAVETQQGRVAIAQDTQALQNADKAISAPAVSRWIQSQSSAYLTGAVNGANIDSDGQNLISAAMADKVITPEEKQNILAYTQNVRMQAKKGIREEYLKQKWGKNYTIPEIDKMIDDSMADLTEIEKAVTNEDMQQATQLTERLKAMQDQDTYDLLQDPDLRKAAVVGKISSDAGALILNEIFQKNGGGLAWLDKVGVKNMLDSSVNTPDGLPVTKKLDLINNAKGKTVTQKEKMLGTLLQSELDVISDPSSTPEQVNTYVKNNYSTDIDKLFASVDDSLVDGASQRMKLYQKMFDPKMTKSIKDKGSPEALTQYMAAALDKAQQVPEFRRAAADLNDEGTDLNDEGTDFKKFVKIQYDPETNRMKVLVNDAALQKEAFNQKFQDPIQFLDRRNIRVQQIKWAADSYNQVLGTLVPIIEATGQDEVKGVAEFSRNLSLNLGGGEDKGFFGYISKEMNGVKEGLSPDARDEQGNVKSSPTSKWEDVAASYVDPSADSEPIEWNIPEGVPEEKVSTAVATGDYSDLLNLIGKAEGTDKGRGYNETLDYGKWTGGDQNLTDMTLNEVLELQATMLSNPANRRKYGNGKGSSALGRYQIVRKTLRGLIAAMGLTGEEKFDQEMQDNMARILIKGRGKNVSELRSEWEGFKRVPGNQILTAYTE